MSKRNVVIYVAGQRFSLCTEDSDEYVIEVGQKVDVMIKGIQKDNPRLNRDNCATLAALSICDDETKLRRKVETLREQIKEYLKDSESLRKENEMLRARLDFLEKKPAEETTPAKEQKPRQQEQKSAAEESHRYTAFVGRDFRSEKKNTESNQTAGGGFNQQKPTQPLPGTKSSEPLSEKSAPAAFFDDKGLPEEPPVQYSIFDTDFI